MRKPLSYLGWWIWCICCFDVLKCYTNSFCQCENTYKLVNRCSLSNMAEGRLSTILYPKSLKHEKLKDYQGQNFSVHRGKIHLGKQEWIFMIFTLILVQDINWHMSISAENTHFCRDVIKMFLYMGKTSQQTVIPVGV